MLVIKIGGGEGNALEPLLDDIVARWDGRQPWVLVHGGSGRMGEISTALGRPPEFITSPSGYTSRRTDRETALTFTMVCAGDINKRIVEYLQARGVNALGLSGLDGGLLRAKRKRAVRAVENGRTRILRDDYTGTLESVNGDLLRLLLDQGYFPVVSPPALSHEGEIVNVDGDRAAAAVAGALGAEDLVLLTGAPGLLRDARDEGSLIPRLHRSDLDEARRSWAEGRMRIKLKAAEEALDSGVHRVLIGASGVASPLGAILDGGGTAILRDDARRPLEAAS